MPRSLQDLVQCLKTHSAQLNAGSGCDAHIATINHDLLRKHIEDTTLHSDLKVACSTQVARDDNQDFIKGVSRLQPDGLGGSGVANYR